MKSDLDDVCENTNFGLVYTNQVYIAYVIQICCYCTNSMIISYNIVIMATVRKTITFTEQQDKWIKAQITAGEFTNDSEYLRHLVRLDQSKNAKFSSLKTAITKGLEIGISESKIPDIMKKVEDRMKADGRL